LSHDTVEAMIKKYSKQCIEKGIKMPDNPHCHMIRKTRAMDLYKGDMSLPHIQQLLGHENISTTSGFYAFVIIETLSKAMEKANKDMTGQTKKWNKKVLDKIYAL